MRLEQINMVYNWLESHVNTRGLFDLQLTRLDEITAYFRNSDKRFCVFNIDAVIELMDYIKEMDLKGDI